MVILAGRLYGYRFFRFSICRDPEAYSQERIVAAAWGGVLGNDRPGRQCETCEGWSGEAHHGVEAMRPQLQSRP